MSLASRHARLDQRLTTFPFIVALLCGTNHPEDLLVKPKTPATKAHVLVDKVQGSML